MAKCLHVQCKSQDVSCWKERFEVSCTPKVKTKRNQKRELAESNQTKAQTLVRKKLKFTE